MVCAAHDSIQVVDTCLYKGSRDNMSIILLTLDAAPTVSQEAIDQEKELDSRLEAKIQVTNHI